LVKVDKLFLTGLYNLEAVPGNTWLFSNISSEGDRNITISLHDVKLGVEFSVGLGSWCDDGGAEITNINFPMDYSNMEFEFENSGFMLGALLDIIGDVIVVNEKSKLVSIVKNLIKSEVPSLLCEQEMFESTLQENDLPHHDESFMNILNKEGQTLIRDRLTENTVKKIFYESIKRHLLEYKNPIRNLLDPIYLYPLQIPVSNSVFKTSIKAENLYLHNARKATLDSVILVRDESLSLAAFRIQFNVPIAWITGKYSLQNGKLLKFIPIKGSGDFNIDLKKVKVALKVVLRLKEDINTDQILNLEHFEVYLSWGEDCNNCFKFDGVLTGMGELADTIMNQLGVGQKILEGEKRWIINEIKIYLKGLAECILWSPSIDIDKCMGLYWTGLGF